MASYKTCHQENLLFFFFFKKLYRRAVVCHEASSSAFSSLVWRNQGVSAVPHMSCPPDLSRCSQSSFECSQVVFCPSYIVTYKLYPVLKVRLHNPSPHPTGNVVPDVTWGTVGPFGCQDSLSTIIHKPQVPFCRFALQQVSLQLYTYPGLSHPWCSIEPLIFLNFVYLLSVHTFDSLRSTKPLYTWENRLNIQFECYLNIIFITIIMKH